MSSVAVAVSTFRESRMKWILELLQSLEEQTLKDFEVILIVDRNKSYFNKLSDAVKTRPRLSLCSPHLAIVGSLKL